jgi:hypothetical protein
VDTQIGGGVVRQYSHECPTIECFAKYEAWAVSDTAAFQRHREKQLHIVGKKLTRPIDDMRPTTCITQRPVARRDSLSEPIFPIFRS